MNFDKVKTLDDRLRELLALEYERENGPMHKSAEFIRLTKYRGVVSVDLAIAAMHCAFKAGRADAMGAADEVNPELRGVQSAMLPLPLNAS